VTDIAAASIHQLRRDLVHFTTQREFGAASQRSMRNSHGRRTPLPGDREIPRISN